MRRLSHDARTRDSRLTAVPVARCQERCPYLIRRPCSDAGDLPRAMRAPRVLRHLQGSSKQHGDAKLTVLLQTLADCPKARSPSIYARCKAVYGHSKEQGFNRWVVRLAGPAESRGRC